MVTMWQVEAKMNRKQKRNVRKKVGKENYDKLLELIQYETLQSLKKINEKIEQEKEENGKDATENN